MIRTAYSLPFLVTHPTAPFFASGKDIRLEIHQHDGVDTGSAHIEESVRVFTDLATTGAFAGDKIEPWHSGLAAIQVLTTAPGELAFRLEQCHFDDSSLVVLCDLLLGASTAQRVKSVAVKMEGGAYRRLVSDTTSFSTYPERYASLPFSFEEEEPESGSFSFVLTLSNQLDKSSRASLREALGSWTACVLAGGYALAPNPPDENYVEVDAAPIEYDLAVEWAALRLRAHPSAVDGLVNLFAAFHGRHRQITKLAIEL